MGFLVQEGAVAVDAPAEEQTGKRAGVHRLALAQLRSTLGSERLDPRDENLSRALEAIERASREGAQLVVFGELFLSGYRTDEWLHKWATDVYPPDEHVQILLNSAKVNDVHILMGAATRGYSVPGDIYNSVLVISPSELVGVYRKCHVAAFPHSGGLATERCFYSPGREVSVYETSIGCIGAHVCYDIAFPEVARVQSLKGASVLINCAAAVAGFESWWNTLLAARAIENASWYVLCNGVGEQRDNVLFGRSQVLDPTGAVVAVAKEGEEDVLIVDIDLALPRRLRATSHVFNTRQPELYTAITEPNPYP